MTGKRRASGTCSLASWSRRESKEIPPETGWLFDPDFGLVLPEDVAGRQVIIDEGLSLAFPITYQAIRKPPCQIGRDGARSLEHRSPANDDRQLYVTQAEDAAQLILSGFGMYLGKKSERLQVKLGGKALYEFPFFRISEVVVASRGVSLSSDLLKEFCERGIRLTFIEASGRPYAMLSSPVLTATVESRREQLLAYRDERGLDFARLIVRGKIRNQRHLLLYFGKYLKQSDAERFDIVSATARKLRALELQARQIEGTSVGEKRAELMGLEGVAGRLYWEGVRTIVESKAEFMGRVHQGAADAFNSLLNYGYGILYAHVWGAVVNAGLGAFCWVSSRGSAGEAIARVGHGGGVPSAGGGSHRNRVHQPRTADRHEGWHAGREYQKDHCAEDSGKAGYPRVFSRAAISGSLDHSDAGAIVC